MFASLKNKIREETGSDLSKLTAKITTSTVQRIDSLRGKGSTSSLNSLVSSDGQKDDASETGRNDEDLRKKVQRLETEIVKKLEEKDKEFKEILSEKDKRISSLEKEKDEAYKHIHNLKESLKNVEDFKQKLVERQEDKEQIESFQTQELSKVKHLVLLREQELEDKTNQLKEATLQLEKFRSEVNRLRRFEEQLSDVQDDLESLRHSSARDMATLASDLAKSEEERRHLTDLVAILRERSSSDHSDQQFAAERKLLEQRLEEAHLHLADIKTSWSDKIASLETQVGRLSRQAAEEGSERRRAVDEKDVLLERVRQLECELECNNLELNNKDAKMKRLTLEIEELSTELKNLRSESEEEVAFLRVQIQNTKIEMKAVKKNLENTECELEKHEEECSKLRLSVDSEHQTNGSLRQVITKLENDLDEEKKNSLNVQRTLTRVTAEKNTALLRNAEISQQMEIVKQETRRQENEMNDLLNKINQLEDDNNKYKEKETKGVEQELRNTVTILEEQLADKNKNIKTLQLRLADMKKTLQQELRTTNHSGSFYDNNESAAILTPSQITTRNHQYSGLRKDDEDVNFTYLKHVIIKFLTSREYEAQHLKRVVATLLKFSPEEEKLLNDTLEWKMSWFGSRPKVGKGQNSKGLPHS